MKYRCLGPKEGKGIFNIILPSPHILSLFHSFSLKPIRTKSSAMINGLFTNIPFVDKISICSNSDIELRRSFRFICLYNIPLVLKNFFIGNPLLFIHCVNSWTDGLSSTICLSSYPISLSSNHFFAFRQVLHFGYSRNKYLNLTFLSSDVFIIYASMSLCLY